MADLWQVYGFSALAFGLIVGSFLNVCIARLPEDRSIVSPPSHCPACGHRIRAYDNVPVVSWLILRGRCRDCGAPISSVYPAIELLTGLLAWLLYRRIIPSPADLDLAHGAAFLFYFSLAAILVTQTYIDLRHQILLDELSIYAVPYAVAGSALVTWLGYDGALALPWTASVLGALVGGAILMAPLLFWEKVLGYEGMGWGDPKLLALIGAFLGPVTGVPFVLFVSTIVGAVTGLSLSLLQRRGLKYAFPFGPFLALSAIVYLLHGPALLERYYPHLPYIHHEILGF